MSASTGDAQPFTLARLSAREREVLDLAVLGRTDQQISQELGMSVSTVNSYWVRIRGKLGQLSRAEFVGSVLRQESDLRYANLIAENERLDRCLSQLRVDFADLGRELSESERNLRNERGSGWHLQALDHAPDATFVCRPPGEIVYANLRAERLFAAEPGELTNLRVWQLAIPEDQESTRCAASAFFEPSSPPRAEVGIERPLYAHRRDGTNFRALLVAERFLAPDGMMSVVTVREYLHELEALVRHLRKPFGSV